MVKLIVGLFAVTAIAVSSGFAAAHNQHQPTDLTGYTKEQCKDGGWEALGFKNQGDCVSYFATGGHNPPAGSNTTEETNTNVETTVNVTGGASVGMLIIASINAPTELNINVPAVAN